VTFITSIPVVSFPSSHEQRISLLFDSLFLYLDQGHKNRLQLEQTSPFSKKLVLFLKVLIEIHI
jgi:hypothetical protein